MVGDDRRRGGGELVDPGAGQGDQITVEIAAVRGKRVAGQPPLDGEVVEVGAQNPPQRR
jgi:hypothetical protein